MSKGIFETLRELESDELRFPEIEHGGLDIRIEATSYLKGDDIDVMVREKLSHIMELDNMRCESSQDPPPIFHNNDPYWEYELKAWKAIPRVTYYTFLYDITAVKPSEWKPSDEVPDKHVGETFELTPSKTIRGVFLGSSNEALKLINESGQGKCPDCKDGFYIPFVGPKETCQTCNGTMKVAVGKPPMLRPSTGDDLKNDFWQYVSGLLGFINLGTCNVLPYNDWTWNEEICFRYTIEDRDLDPTIKWDGAEFAKRFCEAVRVDLLNRVGSQREIKLHFDLSSLKIDYSSFTRTHDMFIVFHVRVMP